MASENMGPSVTLAARRVSLNVVVVVFAGDENSPLLRDAPNPPSSSLIR